MTSLKLQNCKAHVDFYFGNNAVGVAITEDYQRCECSFNLREFLNGINEISNCGIPQIIITSIRKNSLKLKLTKADENFFLEYLEDGCERAHFAKIQLNEQQFEDLKIMVIRNL